MANRRPVTVACPQCSKQSTFTIWQNIDSMQDPMLKQQIIDGTICDFKCPYCEYGVAMSYDLLFNMSDHGVMLHMICDEKQALNVPAMIEAQEDELEGDAKKLAKMYIHRVVPDVLTLREKTLIFEQDLDDRVIELMKVIYAGQCIEQKKGDPEYVFFALNAKQEKQFEMYAENGALIAIAMFDMNLYKSLQHSPKRKLKPIRNDRAYFVDRAWAMNSIK